MRVAPAGLLYYKERAFRMAAEFAAMTHGHPSGYLSVNHEECLQSLKQAQELSKSHLSDVEAITQLGEGWGRILVFWIL